MSLIVENGTGRSDAESYASVADLKAYCDARGLPYEGASDAAIEQALRRATEYLDGAYRARWSGYQRLDTQALCWPRLYARPASVLSRGYLPSDAVPQAVVRATCECAVRELASPGGLAPDESPADVLTSVSIGPISADFATGNAGAGSADAAPVLTGIERLVAPLLRSGAGALVLRA